MRLSVCCLAGAPGPRLRALIEPLREVADEVVIGADSRLGADDLAEYVAVGDRVARVEFEYLERHFSWLHAQCSGDWIFRIDADEIATAELVEALPGLMANRDVRQHWIPRRWLYPDTKQWLNEPPWWPDYQLRLYRRDAFLRFAGTVHSSAVSQPPSEYVELPLYHLDLVVNSFESRQEKARFYDELRPEMEAPGGGAMNERYYLPELAPTVELEDVPVADHAEIERVLSATPRTDLPAPRKLPLVTNDETAQWLDDQPFDPSVHRATIEPTETTIRMIAGEERVIHFRVTNTGERAWPWFNPEIYEGHQVRLSYHWFTEAGDVYDYDGLRTWLPRRLPPNESTVVPLMVLAPEDPGTYVLEVDLVHEQWFGSATRVAVPVAAPADGAAPRRPRPDEFPPLFADFLSFEVDTFGDPTPTAAYDPYLIRYGEYRFILDSLPLEPGCAIADVGCEANILMLFLAVRGATVTGIDVDAEVTPLIEERRALVRRATGTDPSFRFEVQDATRLELEPDSVDAVIATSSIEHMFADDGNGDEMAVDGIARALKPGGVAAITVPMSGGAPFHECRSGDERFAGPYRLYTPATLQQRFLLHPELETLRHAYLVHTSRDPRFGDGKFQEFWLGLPMEERLRWSWANPTLETVFNPIVERDAARGHDASLNTALMLLRKRTDGAER